MVIIKYMINELRKIRHYKNTQKEIFQYQLIDL